MNLTTKELIDGSVVVVWAKLACLVDDVIINFLIHFQLNDRSLQFIKLLACNRRWLPPLTIFKLSSIAHVGANPVSASFAIL